MIFWVTNEIIHASAEADHGNEEEWMEINILKKAIIEIDELLNKTKRKKSMATLKNDYHY